MLLDPDVPDEVLRPFLIDSAQDSGPFRPVVQVNPAKVEADLTEGAVLLASLNGLARARRQRRYRDKIKTWTGPRIVSEGDSWFQYPFLLKDVIDWLSEPYAIWSLDAAGDLIADMVRQGELVTAVVQERPDLVLLSGGGNDLLGSSNLARAVAPYEAGRAAEDYLGGAFDTNLRVVLGGYRAMLDRLSQVAAGTPVLCHVYDHAVPKRGRWLGRPLAAAGIEDPALQLEIIRVIVDRFHAKLSELINRYDQVHLVDTRNTVNGRWHDELHPTDSGYASVAQLFARLISKLTNTREPEIVSPAGVEAVAETGADERELDLLAQQPRSLLLNEIGRRLKLRDAGDPEIDEPLLIFPSSVDQEYPEFAAAGAELLSQAQSEAKAAGTRGVALAHELAKQGHSRSIAMLLAAAIHNDRPG
jgi:lysophospholipase L1-like esterase